MKQYYGRSTPSSQTAGKTNIITGEPIGESGVTNYQPTPSVTNSSISHGRGKNESGERLVQREKELKYKEELDRWVEQNKAHKAAEGGENPYRKKPQSQADNYGGNYGAGANVGAGDAYGGTAYQRSEGKHHLDADERKKQQKELLEGYKAVMDGKKRNKDQEKERDKHYQRQQYEEILKQDYQREEHFRKLKSGGMQQDLKSRQQQNTVQNQAGLEALDQEQARLAYEARQPARFGDNKSSQPQSAQHIGEPPQHSYGGPGAGEYDYQEYAREAYDRAMLERGPGELNKQPQYEAHGQYHEQDSPRRQEQEEKGGWQYYENADHSPKKSEPANDYGVGAGQDKKRGGTGSQPVSSKMGNRSAKDDYILNRQRYGNHGGFNIISHQ